MIYILVALAIAVSGCSPHPVIVHDIECNGTVKMKQVRCSPNPLKNYF